MPYITTKDGTEIFYKDQGSGPAILFSHGWPLSSDAWDAQMVFFGQRGYRVIAHDRRSHGRSSQTWDGIRKGTYEDRSQFYWELTMPFFGYNRPGAKVSEGVRKYFWLQGMMGGLKGQLDCIHEFSEVDYTEDLKKIDVPVLVIHGDDDQIVPIGASAMMSSKILKNATLKVVPGAPHGYAATNADEFSEAVLAFITGKGA